jgi:carbamoyltransferase
LTTYVLGISAYYHDSAAALLADGRIVAAAQEERFTRKKHDPSFPAHAIEYCLRAGDIALTDVGSVVFYDKPFIKFERLLETYVAYAPRGWRSFVAAMPVWLKEKLFLKSNLKKSLAAIADVGIDDLPQLLFTEHHEAHAASAFYPSPFSDAAVLCLDGVGEWATTTAWHGHEATLDPLWQINFPHSLGLLYSAFTYYVGFKVNSGEYKLMGLAPYGEPGYVDLIERELIDIKPDGSFHLNMGYFNYATGLTMTNKRFHSLFGHPPRAPESELTQFHMDIARSIQAVTEKVVLALARSLRKETGARQLCLAGGVALNCVANGLLIRESVFDDVWIQPAAGDAGGALGAAMRAWHLHHGAPRDADGSADAMSGSYLGEAFDDTDVRAYLDQNEIAYQRYTDSELFAHVADLLANGKVIGWFNGRMEFGPRALGGRSIIADPRNRDMQGVLNLKIKFRESFRPFAPAVLSEHAIEWFDLKTESPYMLVVADVAEAQRKTSQSPATRGFERLGDDRSTIPAVTHVDSSARVQTVHAETNPRFHGLLEAFAERTGCPVLINTSFNVRGEPIVRTPEDAYRCFMHTGIDYLVIGNVVIDKRDQPAVEGCTDAHLAQFELD